MMLVADGRVSATTSSCSARLVQCDGLQLIHDARPRLHQAMQVPRQLPQIPALPAWHPDLRETIF